MTYRILSRTSRTTARLGFALIGLVLAATAARTEVIEQILVKVNGEILTKTDLETRQVQALRARGQSIDLTTDKGSSELRKALNEITPGLLVSSVDEMLMVQRGKELGYKLSDEQFKRVLDSLKTQNKIENDEQLQAALKQEGMTMVELRRNMERQMLYSNVQQVEVFARVAVTEEEARKYYDAHTTEFTTPSSVMLREILVAVPTDARGVNAAADEAAKSRGEQIRARVAGGESFEKVAAEVSDSASKANGGLLGPLNMTDLSADFRKLIEGLKPGEMTQVVRTPRGYQVLKLESSTQAQVLPFEQAREQISEKVFTDKRRDEFQKYITKLRSQAIIEWKNDEVKTAYQEGLAQQAKEAAPAPPAL
jgi:peptidyl-prolyl cis-trans isomerase SurA